jgi:hypothetical protein
MFLVMGSRNMIVYMSLSVAVFWHYAIKRIPLKGVILIGVICFVALNIVGYLRTSRYQSLSDFWSTSASAYDKTGSEQGRFFYTLTTGEFVVPFETFPQMVKSVGSDLYPHFGITYLWDASQWIPGILFPGRPSTLTHWYMETFYERDTGLNIGRSFFFLSEGYLNFGPIGVFLTMAAWGVFFGVVHSYMHKAKGEPGAIMLAALTVAFIYRGIAGDFSTLFVSLPEQSLSAAVIGIWISNFGARRNRGSVFASA